MKFLRTQYAALAGIILILLATVKHAYEVYTSIMYVNSEPDLLAQIYIITMLVAIDFAVLLFTIHGNSYAAQTFAFMIFLLNLFAFWHKLSWPGWEAKLFIYFPGLLFSAMFSYGLYYFTDVFSDLLYKAKQEEEIEDKYQIAQNQLEELKQLVQDQQENLTTLSEEKEELLNQIFDPSEAGESVVLQQRASQFELLLRYIIEGEGYLEKSPEALRKGVEYWQKKKREHPLQLANTVKLLAYKQAQTLKVSSLENTSQF